MEETTECPSEIIYSQINYDFQTSVIKEIFKTQYSNPKTKISDDALDLMNKVMKAIVVETAIRAARQVAAENRVTVDVGHIETVLPQIMLDFP